ncbi:MAG TPA: hypothetical protein VEB19_04420, partial [Gemmatimonadaceae bacterium]|nr:hypothetical protein [Gemmatimonadaceae bacterium]
MLSSVYITTYAILTVSVLIARRPCRNLLSSLFLLVVGTGCRDAIHGLGSGRDSADRATELFSSLGARTADPWRDVKFDTARVRLASAAVLPSRVW